MYLLKAMVFIFSTTSLWGLDSTGVCPKWPDEVRVDLILSDIEKNTNIDSVEDVICRLPKTVLDNYSLVGKSASAQSSSLKHPRVILFKKKKNSKIDFMLSFNGNGDDSNYRHVEVLKINRGLKVIDPLEYIDVNFDHEETGKRVRISGPNPPECLQCHGINTKPRPIWDAECFFPTSYNRTKLTTGDSIPRITNDLSKFLKIIRDQPRYSHLQALFMPSSTVQKQLVENNNFIYRDLADINLNRVADLIYESPDFDIFKFSILAALIGCDEMESFLPSSWHDEIKTKHINVDFDGAGSVIRDYLRDSEHKVDPITWSCTRHDVSAIKNFRWLIEGRGISMEEWAMDTPKNGNFGFYRFLGKGRGTEAIASRIAKKDSQLRMLLANYFSRNEIKIFYGLVPEEAFKYSNFEKLPRICSALKKESLINLKRFPPSARTRIRKEKNRYPSDIGKKDKFKKQNKKK